MLKLWFAALWILTMLGSAVLADECEPPSVRFVNDTENLSACNGSSWVTLLVTTGCSAPITSISYVPDGDIKVLIPHDEDPVKSYRVQVVRVPGSKSSTAKLTVTVNWTYNHPDCTETPDPITFTIPYTLEREGDAGCSGCGSNAGKGPAGNAFADLASVHAGFYLGMLDEDTDAGFLSLDAELPSNDLTKAQSLQYNFEYPGVMRYPASGTLQQVKAKQVLARVIDTSPTDYSFSIEFFHLSDIDATGTGPWAPNSGATPFVIWTVRNPSSNIKVVEVSSSAGRIHTFTYDDSSLPHKWSLSEGSNPRTIVAWEETVGVGLTNKIREVRNGTTLLERTRVLQQTLGDHQYVKESSEGSGSSVRTTLYTLITAGAAIGRPSRIDYPDGRWEVMEYDDDARVTTRYQAYKDLEAPAAGVTPTAENGGKIEFSYAKLGTGDATDRYFHPGRARVTTEYVPSYSGTAWEWVAVSRRVFWTPDADTSKEGVTPSPDSGPLPGDGSWLDSQNLVTTTVRFDVPGAPASYGRTKLIVHPDGTGSSFTYTVLSSGDLTVAERRGPVTISTTSPPVIDTGTLTTTVQSSLGRLLSVTVQNLASGAAGTTLSQLSYSYFGSGLQEDYTTTDLAGRVTTYLHSSCCGLLESVTDPDGRVTEYEYDDLRRRVATKTTWGSAWVKMTNVFDGAGRTLAVQRIPSSGATVTLDRYAYDVLGRVTHHTNAWGGVTTSTYDASHRTNTTTFPDLGTRIETTYRDGRTKQVSGTAVAPIGYDYGVQPDGPESIMREVVRTIRLTTAGATIGWDQAGATNEWTLDVSDDLGRNLRTYYAKASGSSYSEDTYNTLGQVVSRRDADGVTELYTYNPDGTRDRTVLDMNGDGVITENDGDPDAPDDRISYSEREVVPLASSGKTPPVDLVRIRTYAFANDDTTDKVLISVQETSTDGRRSWSTVYRDGTTPVMTYSEVGTVSSGIRTDKVVNPDLTSVERVYTQGRLTTVREKDSAGAQVSSVTYAYDPHGRLSSQTDARNGATSFTYYDSDSLQSTLAPVLGNGEPRQVTTSYYDSTGRNNGQLLPDGSTVTNFYYPTGLLQRTFGSRTYPVEYSYDSQGRMKTMKTWQSFNGGAGTPAVTTWNYDPYRGWLVSKDYANPTTGAAGTDGPTYTYSDGGRLASRTWARGMVTMYDYTVTSASPHMAGALRLIWYTNSPSATTNPTPTTTYSYDRRGRMTAAIRDGITTTYTYNEANQPVGESHSGGALDGLSIARTYDSSLRLATLDAVRSGSSVQLVGYTYDAAGRLDQVRNTNSTSHTAQYTYEANSRLIRSVAFTNNASGKGMLTTRTWDRLNRLGSIHSQAHISSTSLGLGLGHTYTYNAANQRTRADLADGSYWVYEYDRLGQVISGRRYWGDGTLMAGQDFTYQFDDIGNRDTTGGRASAVSDYSANHLNQYETRTVPNKLDILGVANPTQPVEVWKDSDSPSTASRSGEYFHQALTVAYSSYPEVFAKSLFVPNQQASAGRSFVPPALEDFDHDLDGNLIKDGRWTAYVWDGENRLIEMKRDTATPTEARQRLTFEYDHLGRRVRKRFFTPSGTNWAEQRETIYLYDGWNVVAELDGNNANATLRTYVWGTDLSRSRSGAGGVGGLLWVNNSQTTGGLPTGIQFVAYDGNGNVSGLTSATDGSNTARYEYGPFGEPLRTTGPLAAANPIRWSTKVTDDETGLVYYGFRYYSLNMGRWQSRDPLQDLAFVSLTGPIVELLTTSPSANPHSFSQNSPLSLIDILGLIDYQVIQAVVTFTPEGKLKYDKINGNGAAENRAQIEEDAKEDVAAGVKEAETKLRESGVLKDNDTLTYSTSTNKSEIKALCGSADFSVLVAHGRIAGAEGFYVDPITGAYPDSKLPSGKELIKYANDKAIRGKLIAVCGCTPKGTKNVDQIVAEIKVHISKVAQKKGAK
jgi:RHS repeat-associated protein